MTGICGMFSQHSRVLQMNERKRMAAITRRCIYTPHTLSARAPAWKNPNEMTQNVYREKPKLFIGVENFEKKKILLSIFINGSTFFGRFCCCSFFFCRTNCFFCNFIPFQHFFFLPIWVQMCIMMYTCINSLLYLWCAHCQYKLELTSLRAAMRHRAGVSVRELSQTSQMFSFHQIWMTEYSLYLYVRFAQKLGTYWNSHFHYANVESIRDASI